MERIEGVEADMGTEIQSCKKILGLSLLQPGPGALGYQSCRINTSEGYQIGEGFS